MDTTWLLQWIGCLFGVLGSFLLATNSRYSGYGFVAFLASNAAWVVFGWMTGAPGLVWMQAAFTVTSLLGIYRWFFAPRYAPLNTYEHVIYNPKEFHSPR